MSGKILVSLEDTFNLDSFYKWLSTHFPVERVPREYHAEADYFIGGDFGYLHETFHGVKIFFTGENHAPDHNNFDYSLTHAFVEDERCHRLPFWQVYPICDSYARRLAVHQPRPISPDELAAEGRDFCAFICRNDVCRQRNSLVRNLSAQRKVNCAGPFMNNVGFLLPKGYENKIEYQRRHLFSMAYENEAHPGYQTEKIVEALQSRSIPLYWGNPLVEDEFNPAAFIHARHFSSERELIRHILELAEDPVRMASIINAPRYRDPLVLDKAEQALIDFFSRIFERGPSAIRRTRSQRTQAVLSRFYGRGFFRTFRRVSRHLRGKGGDQGLGTIFTRGKKRKKS